MGGHNEFHARVAAGGFGAVHVDFDVWVEGEGLGGVVGMDGDLIFEGAGLEHGDGGKGGVDIWREWSKRKRLKERMARISACLEGRGSRSELF